MLARVMGCDIGKLPFSYFVYMYGVTQDLKLFWNFVIERVDKILNTWSKN